MAKNKRKFRVDEAPAIEGDTPSKRRLLRSGQFKKDAAPAASTKEEATSAESTEEKGSRVAGLNSLPTELKFQVVDALANQPPRSAAHDDLAALRLANRTWGQAGRLPEGLLRRPGVESRHVAVCLDVAGGMAAADAIRQHDPLPASDEFLKVEDVDKALVHATPEHLADLANSYETRKGPASELVFRGMGRAISYMEPERMRAADLDTLATLADACSKQRSDVAIEKIATTVWDRRFGLDFGNSRQIASFASVCSKSPEDDAEHCLDFMADKLIEHRAALFRGATDEQLTEMHEAFELAEGYADDPDYANRQLAWTMVGEAIARRAEVHELQASSGRPALDNRDRGRSVLGD